MLPLSRKYAFKCHCFQEHLFLTDSRLFYLPCLEKQARLSWLSEEIKVFFYSLLYILFWWHWANLHSYWMIHVKYMDDIVICFLNKLNKLPLSTSVNYRLKIHAPYGNSIKINLKKITSLDHSLPVSSQSVTFLLNQGQC